MGDDDAGGTDMTYDTSGSDAWSGGDAGGESQSSSYQDASSQDASSSAQEPNACYPEDGGGSAAAQCDVSETQTANISADEVYAALQDDPAAQRGVA